MALLLCCIVVLEGGLAPDLTLTFGQCMSSTIQSGLAARSFVLVVCWVLGVSSGLVTRGCIRPNSAFMHCPARCRICRLPRRTQSRVNLSMENYLRFMHIHRERLTIQPVEMRVRRSLG